MYLMVTCMCEYVVILCCCLAMIQLASNQIILTNGNLATAKCSVNWLTDHDCCEKELI